MKTFFDAFDKNPPTTDEVEFLLVDSSGLVEFNEAVQNGENKSWMITEF